LDTSVDGHGSTPAEFPTGRAYWEFGCIAPTPIGMSMGNMPSAAEVPSDLLTLLPVAYGEVRSTVGNPSRDEVAPIAHWSRRAATIA